MVDGTDDILRWLAILPKQLRKHGASLGSIQTGDYRQPYNNSSNNIGFTLNPLKTNQ